MNYDGVQGALSLAVSLSAVGIASIVTPSRDSVLVTFTEPVDAVSAQLAGNYQISGATVTAAVLQSNNCSVLLSTSTLSATGSYALTVSNVKTRAGAALPVMTSPSFSYVSGGALSVTPFTVTVTPLTTNNPSPAISGTVSDPLASLSVRVNGNWYPVANNNGAWTLPAGDIPALANGSYDVAARRGQYLRAGGLRLDSQ